MQRQVIVHGGLPVGIAVNQQGQLRFIAVKFHVIDLDDQTFASLSALKAAIGRHLSADRPIAA